MLACVVAGGAFAQARESREPFTPRKIEALHYGDTLFQFFQDQHFTALTGLMASQHFGRVEPHADEAEVLRGGLLLSYGLHRDAGEVFARLIETNAPPAVRDRAWYYLAKIRYQRGLPAEAEDALARVEKPLPAPLEEDRRLLQAQLLMARADHAGAAALLAALPPSMVQASAYARFNLGVALIRSGDLDKGRALLDAIGQAPAATEEQRGLRDRANVALGFAALQAKAFADSRRVLQRVRLEGAHSTKALLGFGWAAAELGEHRAALVPWTELLGRPLADAAVLEARIAVPYAYGELGASGQALDRYEDAVRVFGGERRALDESIAAIRAGRLVASLLQANPRAGMGWFGALETLPGGAAAGARMPHGAHLAPVLAGHEFQEAFKNLRDLIFLGDNLDQWQGKLAAFQDMLANRRLAFEQRLPRVRAAAGAADLPAQRRRRDALAAELDKAEAEPDGLVFMDDQQRDAKARLERGQAALRAAADLEPGARAEIGTAAELAQARERLERLQGALLWQSTQQFSERLWTAKKALKAADTALAEAEQRDAALLRAAEAEPKRFEAFAQRIAALGQRIVALQPRIVALKTEQQGQLQAIAVAELEAQKERLEIYAQQARLAIAQLHDRAQLAQRRPDAGPGAEVPR